MWISTTLRAYYSPDQYEDNFAKPIGNDCFRDERLRVYHSTISEWISSASSPLTPLLRACKEGDLKYRSLGLLKILYAAGKLSVQLWAQSSKVTIIGKAHRSDDSLSTFDDEIATFHALTQGVDELEDWQGRAIDLIVWPRVQVTRFNSVYPHGGRPITTKASILICDPRACQVNMDSFEDTKKLLANATMTLILTQKISTDQEQGIAIRSVKEQTVGSSESSVEKQTDNPGSNPHHQCRVPLTTTAKQTQNVCISPSCQSAII